MPSILICIELNRLTRAQGFVADCTEHFHRMQVKQSWADTDYRNGAEAMAAILEVMRRHEVHLSLSVHWSISRAALSLLGYVAEESPCVALPLRA